MTIKVMLVFSIILWCADAMSEVSLVLPVATTHIEYTDAEYNNNNYGLGVEYMHNNKHILGVLYLNEDSFYNENLYFYYGRRFQFGKDFDFSFSGFAATSYDASVFTPLVSASYKFVRVVTSYPFAKIAGEAADIVNVQVVIPLNF